MNLFKKLLLKTIWIFFFLFLTAGLSWASELPDKLLVGTRQVPPFAMQDKQGNWSGITIELWEIIAEELDLEYTYQSFGLDDTFEGVKEGNIDLGVAAFSITSQRETIVDFSHPFYYAGLGIAVASKPAPTWARVIYSLISWDFIKTLGVLILILLVFGFLIWLFERRRNQAQFGGSLSQGIGSGFWWSAVTMTTVGYGDKSPVTLGGRFIALLWMFSGIIIISSITAAITSALTVASLESGIGGPEDLPKVRAATITDTTSADYLFERGINPQLYQTIEEGLAALANGEVEAFVYDAPILAYFINQNYPGELIVLPSRFKEQQYGIVLPFNSRLRQDVNRELLNLVESGKFKQIEKSYLGE